jgi:hypothetical protein
VVVGWVVVVGGGMLVLAVDVVVELVVVATHPPCEQASQQLGNIPTHEVRPLRCATHFVASRLIAQDDLPVLVVRQHVTNPGLPHVDLLAHRLTTLEQLLFASTRFARCAAQLTYPPWVSAPQSQLAATADRAFATSDLSGSIVGSHFAWPVRALTSARTSPTTSETVRTPDAIIGRGPYRPSEAHVKIHSRHARRWSHAYRASRAGFAGRDGQLARAPDAPRSRFPSDPRRSLGSAR